VKTLAELVRAAARRIAPLDAEVLVRHVLRWDRARWLADSRAEAPPGFAAAFDALVDRRASGEPVAYITGKREFWGLDFEVTPDVLIPRPETELLVETALAAVDGRGTAGGAALQGPRIRVADACTGSGCVAIALAHSRPSLEVIATDISEAALHVAARNAERHEVGDRVELRLASGLEGVGGVDLVVANPPYISRAEAPSLMKDVVAFEPHQALFGGGDGLDVIRGILSEVARRTPPPPFAFEFGGNERAVREAIQTAGLRLTRVVRDLQGIPRVAVVEA